MKSRRLFLPLLVVAMIMTGCAPFFLKPERVISPAALGLLDDVNVINTRMKAAKGIGTISSQNTRVIPRTRFAWLCSPPDKIRMEILAPTGNSLVCLAADGKYVYFLDHQDDSGPRRKKAHHLNLEKIIGLPLTINDASYLLAGAIPIHKFDTAKRNDLADGNYMLQLKSRWPRTVENIIFDKTTGRPCKIEFFHGSDPEPEYSVSFNGFQTLNNRTIPKAIILQKNRDKRVVIDIKRFWPVADIPAKKFILTDIP